MIEIVNDLKEKLSQIFHIPAQSIEPTTSLYAYGLDSLAAASIQTFIFSKWQIEIPFEQLLEDVSLETLSKQIIISSPKTQLPISLSLTQDRPLSFQQQGIWTASQLSIPHLYHVARVIQIHSKIEIWQFQKTIEKIVQRHSIFRTTFHENENGIYQRIHTIGPSHFHYLEKPESFDLQTFFDEEVKRPFQLDTLPLFKIFLIKLSHSRYYLFLVAHHLIADLWSLGLFLRELFCNKQSSTDYGDYVAWQHHYLNEERGKKSLQFWMHQFQDLSPTLNLPIDFPNVSKREHRGKSFSFIMPPHLSSLLKEFSQQNGWTCFTSLISAYFILLSLYSREKQLCIGTTTTGRTNMRWHDTLGCFANPIPIRANISSEKGFLELTKQIKQTLLESFAHSDIPFHYFIQHLNPAREKGIHPLFQTMFVFQEVLTMGKDLAPLILNTPDFCRPVNMGESVLEPYHWQVPIAPFDLTLYMTESHEGFIGSFEYDCQLFSHETISSLSAHYLKLLELCLLHPHLRIDALDLREEEEKNCQAFQPMLFSKTISELFSEQAKKNPHHSLIQFKNASFSNEAIENYSNQLAHLLRKRGVGPGAIVAIQMHHSPNLIISILAILKLGSAFLPIDPHTPYQRLLLLLQESQSTLLITDQELTEEIKIQNIAINQHEFWIELEHEPFSWCPIFHSPEAIAYVMYTSGSTGKPKGVAISHGMLLNYLYAIKDHYHMGENLHFPLYSSIAFDLTMTSLLAPLIFGYTVHIYDDRYDLLDILEDIFNHPQMTHVKLTPAHLHLLIDISIYVPQLTLLIVGGEQLSTNLVEKIYEKLDEKVKIINEYGPTEATIGCIFFSFPSEHFTEKTVPIGQPISHTRAYICNDAFQLLPIQSIGNLFLAGQCLAYGYWNQSALTAERFLPDPNDVGKRMYLSGDLARSKSSSLFLCLGRNDRQIKLRGFRIEIGEVEAALMEHALVKEAIVIAQESMNEKYLCAYVVLSDSSLKTASFLRSFLSERIPHYMLPSYFLACSNIPLTINGKVDFKALPQPDFSSNHFYAPPQNYVHQSLIDIWAEVLNYPSHSLGINTHFFEIGGDSIKAIQILSKSRKKHLFFSIADLFDYPTIEQLTEKINETKSLENTPKRQKFDSYPLSPIQEWFFKNYTKQLHQSIVLINKNRFSIPGIELTLDALIDKHPVLQSSFFPNQHFATLNCKKRIFLTFDFAQEENESEKMTQTIKYLQSSLNIDQGPLIALGLFRKKEEDHLVIVIHHLIIDGVSWRIFLEDFAIGYQQFLDNKEVHLSEELFSFAEWTHFLKNYSENLVLHQELDYWKAIQEKGQQIFNPPRYSNAVPLQEKNQISLSKTMTTSLLQEIHHCYHTQINDILLSAFAYALSAITQTQDHFIYLETHGRHSAEFSIDLSRTVGWFTCLVPIILSLPSEYNLRNLIRSTKEMLRKIPSNGMGYQILATLTSSQPLTGKQPVILFNYLGEFQNLHYTSFSFSPLIEDLSGSCTTMPHQLEVNCLVIEGCFHLYCRYHPDFYHQNEISQFLLAYQQHLEEIIIHCKENDREEKTPSDFHDLSFSLTEYDRLTSKLKDIQWISPLSSMQQGLFFQSQVDPHQAYFEQVLLNFEGEIEVSSFKFAFECLIAHHDALRTAFFHEELSLPRQVVFKHADATFEFFSIAHHSHEEQLAYLEEYRLQDAKKGFVLNKAPLMRWVLFDLGTKKFQLIWSFHHLILDGWSLSLLFKEWLEILAKGKAIPKITHFTEYVQWQLSQDKRHAIDYWKKTLMGYDRQLQLGYSQQKKETAKRIQEYSFDFDKEQTQRLHSFSNHHHITLSTLWHVAWGLLLMSYNHCDDVVFGSVFSGRQADIKEIGTQIGLFIQTLPVRITASPSLSFISLLLQTQKQLIEHEQYSFLSLQEILSESSLKTHLINHLLVIENYPFSGQAIQLVNEQSLPFRLTSAHLIEETHYDFSLAIIPGEKIEIKIQYNTAKYSDDLIHQIEDHLKHIVFEILKNPHRQLNEISFLTQEEEKLLSQCNHTYRPYTKEKTLRDFFEEQVNKSPEAVALIFENQILTYAELNRQADSLAYRLIHLGLKTETLVGICLPRSPSRIIAWLAVLKAGGTYVPLDPEHPIERLQTIIEETHLPFLLTEEKLFPHFSTYQGCLVLDTHQESTLEIAYHRNFIHPLNLAYILYTSGSTGKPKGIAVHHEAIANHFTWICEQFHLNSSDRMLHLTSFSFDVSLCECYVLFVGGTLILAPEQAQKDMLVLMDTISKHRVTFLQISPSLLTTMSNEGLADQLKNVRQILCGADILKATALEEWYRLFSIPIANLYGLTETCIDATFYQCPFSFSNSTIPIGKPISNMQAYIFNDWLNCLPIYGIGELYLAGDGLARGYFQQPVQTAERFLPNSFLQGKRMYKTGDLATWLIDGNLQFRGRIDNQVKIRGLRIELQEIESAILTHPIIKEVVVQVLNRNEDEKIICAYIVGMKAMTQNELRQFLVSKLPTYMIPSEVFCLEKIPLTLHGKIDFQKLPKPLLHPVTLSLDQAPKSNLEKELLNIWKKVLKIEEISIHHHFFDIGGNSMTLMQTHYLICQLLKQQIPIHLLFEYSTIKDLASFLEQRQVKDSIMEETKNQAQKQRSNYLKIKENKRKNNE